MPDPTDPAPTRCGKKRIFATYAEAAAQRGQYAYQCRACRLWHRTGSAIAIARKIAHGHFPKGGLYQKPGREKARRG